MSAASYSGRARWLRLLKLDAHADVAAIKRRYRELAKTAHPDVVGPSGAARFNELTEAYQYLLSSKDDVEEARQTEGPAMAARWNIRRKHQASEYPAWFKPEDATGKGDGGAGDG